MDAKRKLKELEYQNPYKILEAYKRYKKEWARTTLAGSGIVIDFTCLGGRDGFECFVAGEAYDEFIRPAIEKALEKTLEMQMMYLDMQKGAITAELNKK